MKDCPFCNVEQDKNNNIVFSNEYCIFLQKPQEVLIGSGIIIPKEHRENVFDLTEEELNASFDLLHKVKEYLDKEYKPQGYNVGWNVGEAGGQEIMHAHLHIIPRFSDEPLAGKGIRYWIKQPQNSRNVDEEELKEKIKQEIYYLENHLLQPEIRQSSEKIAELLHDDFYEFCSSGKVYNYSKGDVFDKEADSLVLKREIKNFCIKVLSNEEVMATYTLNSSNELAKETTSTLRSSIWRKFGDSWKIIFHQGTKSSEKW